MYQVDIIFEEGRATPSPEEMTVIIENALLCRGYYYRHVSTGFVGHRKILALKHGEPEEQLQMSEREAQAFAHNYPGMHLFFADVE